jgi:TatD DNase family protein
MRLVDAHCHLASEEFEGRLDEVLDDARNAGIVAMISSATRPGDWPRSRMMAGQHSDVFFTLGIHPWFVTPHDTEAVRQLHEAPTLGACAIGEIGLDTKIETPSIDLQICVFELQLVAAREAGLPVVVHCRGAFDALLRSVKAIGLPSRGGVIHAYSGSAELADEFIKLGFSFSMGRSLTYRNSRKREEVLRRIYPDHFLLETDSPDMPPVEAGDSVNVPANIRYNLRAAAEVLGLPEEEVAETTTRNAVRVFNLPL